MATPLTQNTGRRKEAVARVRLVPGTGKVVINGKPIEGYFTTQVLQLHATAGLKVAGFDEAYDVHANCHGGGVSGQAGAVRLGIARAIAEIDPEQRGKLKEAGLLTRDPRAKESKKYGLKKARKAPQYSKR
jgi:small subunit ribosomal protein S9